MRSASARCFAKRLANQITEMTGETCECDAGDLFPAKGWYRTNIHADVMRWTGTVKLNGMLKSVGSWEPMTAAIKNGFRVTDRRGNWQAYADFEVDVPDYIHPFYQKAIR